MADSKLPVYRDLSYKRFNGRMSEALFAHTITARRKSWSLPAKTPTGCLAGNY
jgi:hypothetical protein